MVGVRIASMGFMEMVPGVLLLVGVAARGLVFRVWLVCGCPVRGEDLRRSNELEVLVELFGSRRAW